MAGTVHDEDDETLHCYRHPARETSLQCVECERPICIETCAVQAAVGFKCPEHARTSRAARGVVPTARLVRGLVAGAVVALVLGAALAFAPVPFFRILLAYGVGIVTGEAARRASGGYRDPVLARGAAMFAAIGVAALPVVFLVGDDFSSPRVVTYAVFSLLAVGAAAAGAFSRAS
ncbi:MAG: hypothetical protein JWM98_725 [Thermoleophilia bacterium]|nr:hypothetical protein [Thermoleophilia bacterium]